VYFYSAVNNCSHYAVVSSKPVSFVIAVSSLSLLYLPVLPQLSWATDLPPAESDLAVYTTRSAPLLVSKLNWTDLGWLHPAE